MFETPGPLTGNWGRPGRIIPSGGDGMRRVLVILAALIGLLAGLTAPAAAQYSSSVAGWEIAGADGVCLGVGPDSAGAHLAMGLGRDAFFMSANSSRHSHGAAGRVSATLSIDDRWQRRLTGTVDEEDLLVFEFDISDPFLAHLRAGNVLRVEAGQVVFKVRLSGTSAAMAALWECGRQVGALAGTGAPARPGAPEDRADEFRVGSWSGEAYSDEDGHFVACMVSGPEDGPVLLLFTRSRIGFEIGLQNDRWSLADGARYPVSVAVDDRWRADLQAQVIGSGSIVVGLDREPAAVDHLRFGNRLTIAAAQQEFRFDLTGSNAAIGALSDCYTVRAGAPPDPRLSEAPAAGRGGAADVVDRGREIVAGVFRLPTSLTQSEVEEIVRSRIAPEGSVWFNIQEPQFFEFHGDRGVRDDSPVTGQVMEVNVPSGLIELAMTALYADRMAECGGDLQSGMLPAESYAGLDLQYAVVQCGSGPEARQVELVLMLVDTHGVLYVIEGSYTDTYRMTDLVVAIQTLGQAVAE